MDLKHFSHIHGLFFHQVPQGSQIQCSACKSPGSGNVYTCWQCNYFLHEHCFRATRSLNHPSHPLHPLTLVLSPTHPSGSFSCNSCNLDGHGLSYSCSACDFDIHVHCALNPNPNPNPHASPAPSFPPHNYNSQPQISTYPPPSHIATTTSNDTQHYPPQTSVYPSVPNNPFPNVNPVYPQPNITPPPPPQPTPSQSNNPMTQHYPPQTPIIPSVPNNSVYPQPNIATPPTPTPVLQRSNPKPETSVTQHFSHPHFLKPNEIDQKNEKACSACDSDLSGPAYTCTEPVCSFNLHKACFDSPREVQHKFHPHPLTLLPAHTNDEYTCDACQKVGKAFVYNCATCSFDLHIDCFRLPEEVSRPDLDHPLSLCTPVSEYFSCSVCKNYVNEKAWVYYCSDCDFGTHLECVHSEIEQENEDEEEEAEIEQENVSEEEDEDEETGDIAERLFKLQQQRMHSEIRLQMAQQNARFVNSMANSWRNIM